MSFDVAEPWAGAMIKVGAVDPRRKEAVPSITQLAQMSGCAVETVRRLIRGDGIPEPETITRVAVALKTAPSLVSAWAKQARSESDEWTPPAEAALLTTDERSALDRLIRAIATPRKRMREGFEALSAAELPIMRKATAAERLAGASEWVAEMRSGQIVNLPTRQDRDDSDTSVVVQEAAMNSPEPAGLPEPEQP